MKNGKSKAIEEVEVLEARLQRADTVNDPAFHEAYFAPDILFTDPQGRPLTKAELVAAAEPPGLSRYSSFDVSERDYTEFGSTVLARCRVDIGIEEFVMPLRFTRLWARRAGEPWQIVFCQITPIIS